MFEGHRYTVGLVLVGVILITVALVVRQLVFGDNMATLTEPVSQQFTTSKSPQIVVETFDGAVELKLGSTDLVSVTVVRRGSGLTESAAFNALATVQVRMTQDGDSVHVRAWREDSGPRLSNTGASVEVVAPPGSSLDLTTSNGTIRTVGFVGPIRAHASNGAVALDGVAAPTVAETSNGSVDVKAGGPAIVQARTSNGSVRFSGRLAPGESVFATTNGSIQLELPGESGFALNASTTNGKIDSDFPLVSGSQSPTRIEATYGVQSGVSIRAESSNGKIEVRRK